MKKLSDQEIDFLIKQMSQKQRDELLGLFFKAVALGL